MNRYDTYTELAELPAYRRQGEHEDYETFSKSAALKWSGAGLPPAIGETVLVRINRIGPSKVLRYFYEHGWLGVLVLPINPPQWYRKQNGFGGACHVFGAEIGERQQEVA
jgi:hypothetical protein